MSHYEPIVFPDRATRRLMFGHPNPDLPPSPGGDFSRPVCCQGQTTQPDTPATFAGVPVAAMEAVMAERTRQITRFGHTPQDDLTHRLEVLPARMRAMVHRAYEDCTMYRPYALEAERLADRRLRITMARKRMVQACALGLAAIDRIDAEIARVDALEEAELQADRDMPL